MSDSRPQQPERLLFVRTDRLGEVLLNLPAVVALRAAYPAARLTVMVHPDLRGLLERVPEIDQFIEYRGADTPWWWSGIKLARRLSAERFDLAIVSNPKKVFHLATFLAGIPQRVGYDRKWGWLLTHRLPDRKALGERHEVEYNLELVQHLRLPTTIPQWPLFRLEREQREVLQLLERHGLQPSEPFVVVHPWTSNPAKQWPTDRFAALIRRVSDHLAVRVVLIGAAEERDRVDAVLREGAAAINLVDRLTLPQLAALLQRARLLVSNDSGPVHVAAALNTKTLVLFGTVSEATGPRRWGPWGTGHVVIWKPSMEAITVEEVFDALQRQLG